MVDKKQQEVIKTLKILYDRSVKCFTLKIFFLGGWMAVILFKIVLPMSIFVKVLQDLTNKHTCIFEKVITKLIPRFLLSGSQAIQYTKSNNIY